MGARWNDGRRFEGRVAVVTGAGGTLGGAVARGFGAEGASVALGYRSSRSEAAKVVAELESQGSQAHAGQLDITDQQSVNAFVADVVQRCLRPRLALTQRIAIALVIVRGCSRREKIHLVVGAQRR